jgi:hypothetical protein
MVDKNRGRRPPLLQGIASALNMFGTAIVVTRDASAIGIEKISGAVKNKLSPIRATGDKSDINHWLEDMLFLTGTSLPDIRNSVREMVEEYEMSGSGESSQRISYEVSSRLIKKCALRSGAFGGLSASPATLPGIGTLGTLFVSLTADLVHLLRTQIELCYGIAAAYNVSMDEEELQAVALALIGFSGTAEAVKGISAVVIRETIDKAAAGHLQTGMGRAATALARKMGLQTSSRLTRLIPFLGITFCASINIASTMMVGNQARRYFSAWSDSPNQLPEHPDAVH